jgi:hypothetical protein
MSPLMQRSAQSFDQLSKGVLNRATFTFLPSVQVNADSGNLVNEFAPVIALSKEGHMYVVWNGDETVKSIFFSRSTDGGQSFSPAVRLNDTVAYPPSYSVYQPDIALDSAGTIFVVWHDYRQWFDDNAWTSPIDIFMDKSTDGGLTWHTDVQASSGSGAYPWHSQPSIAIDGKSGDIYISFTDFDRYYPQGDQGDVSVAVSRNHGETFDSKVRVDDTPDSLLAIQTFSSITYDAAHASVDVVFNDNRNGGTDIYLARSIDSARTFPSNVLVNLDTTGNQEEPTVKAARSGDLYVVWKDWGADPTPTEAPYDNDMLIARSTDGGASFSAGVTINDTHLNAEYSYNFPPRLAIDDSGTVHVAWFDMRYGFTNCFYDESTSGGLTFSQDAVVNDNHDSLSHSLPRIAAGNGRVAVAYMDKRNGNGLYDIFVAGRGQLTGVTSAAPLPGRFTLEQNFPNPFNPTTAIVFSLQNAGFSTLDVFDLLGRKVAVLVDGQLPAGKHSVAFDASHLASGVYVYRLRTGGLSESKRMILMR